MSDDYFLKCPGCKSISGGFFSKHLIKTWSTPEGMLKETTANSETVSMYAIECDDCDYFKDISDYVRESEKKNLSLTKLLVRDYYMFPLSDLCPQNEKNEPEE